MILCINGGNAGKSRIGGIAANRIGALGNRLCKSRINLRIPLCQNMGLFSLKASFPPTPTITMSGTLPQYSGNNFFLTFCTV